MYIVQSCIANSALLIIHTYIIFLLEIDLWISLGIFVETLRLPTFLYILVGPVKVLLPEVLHTILLTSFRRTFRFTIRQRQHAVFSCWPTFHTSPQTHKIHLINKLNHSPYPNQITKFKNVVA